MDDFEVILNLWYVFDDLGFIYSLRARAYLARGTDQEKLKYLHELAETDYLIADAYPVPERYSTSFIENNYERKLQVIHIEDVKRTISFESLFEDIFKDLENRFPSQSNLVISQTPLMVMTPLLSDEDGNIKPYYTGRSQFRDII